MSFMNKLLIGTTCLVLGRYIGRKDEEGRASKAGFLDFVVQMTPVPNPENTDFPYKLPSLLRWPKFLQPERPPPQPPAVATPILAS
jgi:hypothetical protein